MTTMVTAREKKTLSRRILAAVLASLGFLQLSSLLDEALPSPDISYSRRASIDLGGGNCTWTLATSVNTSTPIHSTLFASYPGSGKRLSWLIIEALSGNVVGDDWDLSLHGNHVVALKTGYPHSEGTWTWGNLMDQVVLQVRSPRWALQSYLNIRDELDYSDSWISSFNRRPFVYTERPDVSVWEAWRDENFDREIEEYGKYIDFWMEEGYVSEGGEAAVQDGHCVSDMTSCRPVAVISFERMFNTTTGPNETAKLAEVMNDHPDSNIIAKEAWDCVYNETYHHPYLRFNPDRVGPATESRFFTVDQLNAIATELTRLVDKYSNSPWDTDPLAQDLVTYMTEYLEDVSAEIATM